MSYSTEYPQGTIDSSFWDYASSESGAELEHDMEASASASPDEEEEEGEEQLVEAVPQKRRRRPAKAFRKRISCEPCRKSKKRCSKETSCRTCEKRGLDCFWAEGATPQTHHDADGSSWLSALEEKVTRLCSSEIRPLKHPQPPLAPPPTLRIDTSPDTTFSHFHSPASGVSSGSYFSPATQFGSSPHSGYLSATSSTSFHLATPFSTTPSSTFPVSFSPSRSPKIPYVYGIGVVEESEYLGL
ncbi:C6 zinc finger domain protein [Pseudohyphozyma bogoriensis]|nr:C6 zinc finger domain protein [Pseudohyphozyma bogoriensis]